MHVRPKATNIQMKNLYLILKISFIWIEEYWTLAPHVLPFHCFGLSLINDDKRYALLMLILCGKPWSH